VENIFRLVAERHIQEAIEEGKFDNLPGKGQPLNLEEDMSVPAHLRVANRILKNAGVLPDWMQLDAEIDRERAELGKAWTRIEREYARRQTRALASAGTVPGDPEKRKLDFIRWLAKERSNYIGAMKRVNTEILKLAMMAPSVSRPHLPVKVTEETERFDRTFPPIPGIEAPPMEVSPREDPVREAVREIYAQRRLGKR
jgi:hypothetical protein